MTTQIETLRAQLEQVLAPAKEAYEEVGTQITSKLEELTALRHEQAEIRKLIRSVDPEFEKRTYESSNGSKNTPRSGADKYSDSKIAEVNEWLRANAEQFNEGDGFWASQIVHYEGCPVANQSGLSAILKALHAQGLIRLTRRSGPGGRKVFKVVI